MNGDQQPVQSSGNQPGWVFQPNDQQQATGQPTVPSADSNQNAPASIVSQSEANADTPTEPNLGTDRAVEVDLQPNRQTTTAIPSPIQPTQPPVVQSRSEVIQDQQVPQSTEITPPDISGATNALVGTSPVTPDPADFAMTWNASSFIERQKGTKWYALFFVAAILIIGLIYFVTKDLLSIVIAIAAVVIFGYAASRKPSTIAYSVGPKGIMANSHLYAFADFKSFGVQDEGAFSSLVFMPLKRFMLPVYVYFPPADEDKIAHVISHYLPYAPIEQGLMDRATQRLRF